MLGLVGFGFGEATLRYIAHYHGRGSVSDVNRVMGATLSFYLLMCSAVCLTLFAGAPLITMIFEVPATERGALASLFRVAAAVYVLKAFSNTYGAVPMSLQRYDITSKVNIVQSIVRSAGYIVLALTGLGVLHLVIWDAITQAGVLVAFGGVIRRIAPGVRLLPSWSFTGLREIAGFSMFTFMSHGCYMMQHESAKMVLAAQVGTLPLAYLGAPDNVAQRLHRVVMSGTDTLMPRFSETRNSQTLQSLMVTGTWVSLVASLTLMLPLVILLPDFLTLWIGADFARESAAVGQLVALSYIAQGAYLPTAAYFRGIGKPSVVTVVLACAGVATLLSSLVLVPRYGLIGAGYAYLIGSVPALAGLAHGWFRVFGRHAMPGVLRVFGLPVVMAAVAYGLEHAIRDIFSHLSWLGFLALGSVFVSLSGLVVVGADGVLGGREAPSKQVLARIRVEGRRLSRNGLFPWRNVRGATHEA